MALINDDGGRHMLQTYKSIDIAKDFKIKIRPKIVIDLLCHMFKIVSNFS